MKRAIVTFVGMAAVVAGLATAPAAMAQGECRNTTVGDFVDVRYCAINTSATGTVTVDPNITLTCEINKPVNLNIACAYAPFVDTVVSSVGRTGFVPASGFPPPYVSGTNVSHPGGTLGTLYVNGIPQPVTTPPFCSGTPTFCGTTAWLLALL